MQQKTVEQLRRTFLIEGIDEVVRLDPTGAHSAAHRGADSRCPRTLGRDRDGGSGPDYSPECIID